MRSKLRLAAALLAAMSVVLIAATAIVAANPHAMYTCTRTKSNGKTDVKTSVPEPAVGGLTNAGYTCVAEADQGGQGGQQGGQGEGDQGDQGGQQSDQGGQGGQQGGQGDEGDQGGQQGGQGDEGDQGGQGDQQGEDDGETADEGTGNGSTPGDDSEPTAENSFSIVPVQAPSESRSLYCSTNGPGERGNGDGSGVALNLPDSQGALLVEKGLATPGIFYAGIGVSCDLLPGFTYAGVWVDHVGDVVPGVAVYPYYVPTTS